MTASEAPASAPSTRPRRGLVALGVVSVIFGAATLKEGGSVLFVDGASRHAAGHYVPFVVWFNFLAAFAYVAAGIGIARGRPWAARLALGLGGTTALVFALFGAYVLMGGSYEPRTLGAMAIRTLFWMLVGWRACTVLRCLSRHRGTAPG
jgi:hypothetical protein